MAPPRVPGSQNGRGNKRRRLGENTASTASRTTENDEENGKEYFDPNQDPEERRDVNLGYRKLDREWNGEHSAHNLLD
jgi:hypothetical protein